MPRRARIGMARAWAQDLATIRLNQTLERMQSLSQFGRDPNGSLSITTQAHASTTGRSRLWSQERRSKTSARLAPSADCTGEVTTRHQWAITTRISLTISASRLRATPLARENNGNHWTTIHRQATTTQTRRRRCSEPSSLLTFPNFNKSHVSRRRRRPRATFCATTLVSHLDQMLNSKLCKVRLSSSHWTTTLRQHITIRTTTTSSRRRAARTCWPVRASDSLRDRERSRRITIRTPANTKSSLSLATIVQNTLSVKEERTRWTEILPPCSTIHRSSLWSQAFLERLLKPSKWYLSTFPSTCDLAVTNKILTVVMANYRDNWSYEGVRVETTNHINCKE